MHFLQSGVPFNVIALCGSGTRHDTHSSLRRGRSREERRRRLHDSRRPTPILRCYRAPDSLIRFLQAL